MAHSDRLSCLSDFVAASFLAALSPLGMRLPFVIWQPQSQLFGQ